MQIAGVVLIVAMEVVEYYTDGKVKLSTLHAVPILAVSWLHGAKGGLLLAAVSGLVVLTVEFVQGDSVSSLIPYGNVLVRTGVYAALAVALSRLKSELTERQRLIGELNRVLAERKRAEAELKIKAEELARSNAELEQYASIAAHDLKSPLVVIGGYLQLLRRQCEGQLGQKAESLIARALEGVGQMETVISDLLAYARIGAEDEDRGWVEADDALDQALENLRDEVEANGAAVSRDPLPRVRASRSQLVQVFQNLAANAIKFRGEASPRLHVGTKRDGSTLIFSVRDNGIGIEPGQTERIFRLFERLRKDPEVPGTGIGLAICKKIVERHGGRIWAESAPGRGATFFFTLPATERGENADPGPDASLR